MGNVLSLQTHEGEPALRSHQGHLRGMIRFKTIAATATLLVLFGLAFQAPLSAQNKGPKTAKAGKGPTVVKGIPSAKAAPAKTAPAEKHGNLPSISKASVKPLKLAKVDPQTAERARLAAAHIDGLVEANYKRFQVEPNPLTTDEQFVRRIYLDITGTIPT